MWGDGQGEGGRKGGKRDAMGNKKKGRWDGGGANYLVTVPVGQEETNAQKKVFEEKKHALKGGNYEGKGRMSSENLLCCGKVTALLREVDATG